MRAPHVWSMVCAAWLLWPLAQATLVPTVGKSLRGDSARPADVHQFQRLAVAALFSSVVAMLLNMLAIGVLCRLLGAAKHLEMVGRAHKEQQQQQQQGTEAEVDRASKQNLSSYQSIDEETEKAPLKPGRATQHKMSRRLDEASEPERVTAQEAGAMEGATSSEASGSHTAISPMYAQLAPQAGNPQDLWVFIQRYEWALRYRVSLGTDGGFLDASKPLEFEWVKLRKLIDESDELSSSSGGKELLDWSERAPVGFNGFKYTVVKDTSIKGEAKRVLQNDMNADGSAKAEAKARLNINLLKNKGPQLIVKTDGIRLGPTPKGALGNPMADQAPNLLTHIWVEVVGLPFFPKIRTLIFYCSEELVWKGGQT